jgi:hypothetical protein
LRKLDKPNVNAAATTGQSVATGEATPP